MDPVSITYDFDNLSVTRQMIETMMGYKGEPAPEPIPEVIDEVLSEAAGFSDIRGGYLILPEMQIPADKRTIWLCDREFFTDKIITASFREAEKVILFLFTAGIEYELRAREQLHHGDQIKGYITDVLGSIIVELAVEKMCLELKNDMKRSCLLLTNPYSPGYCGWPVSDQSKLFSFFPDGFAGITLSQSSLMQPIKSVSGMIGAGKKARKRAYQCEICDHTTCIYRNLFHS
jgi:hypothetical protein